MWQGTVFSLHVASVAGAPVQSPDEVQVIPGRGLEGDRYSRGRGTFSADVGSGREVTLIEIETIEALEREHGIQIAPGAARRNVVTLGVPLNHLVGREFRVGEVTLRGARLCEPCSHLARLTHERVLRALVHRGGLRADIVSGGVIRVGDAVTGVEAR